MMQKFNKYWTLFITFFRIGLFTFGGGYAMIPLIQAEIAEKKKWMSNEDILEIIVISESTPGPISINSATYVGYKVGGFFGALFATIGLVLPSLFIIFIISLFIDQFLANAIVAKAFKGIQCAVVLLIGNAALKLSKNIKNNWLNLSILSIVMVLTILFDIFKINFSSIYFIILGGFLGIIFGISTKKKVNDQ